MSLTQDIIDQLLGAPSRRQEGHAQIYQRFNIYNVTDQQLSLIAPILGDNEYHEMFYAVETETYLRWDNSSNCFWDIENNECYFITIFRDEFNDLGFSATEWTFANSGTSVNDWVFGTDGIIDGYGNAMYISNNGINNLYSGDTGISHAYTQRDIPAGSQVRVKVLVRSNGEPFYDDFRIAAYDSAVAPVADSGAPLADSYALMTGKIQHEWLEFILPANFTGGISTFVMQWDNDGFIQGQRPAHIQEVIIQYRP